MKALQIRLYSLLGPDRRNSGIPNHRPTPRLFQPTFKFHCQHCSIHMRRLSVSAEDLIQGTYLPRKLTHLEAQAPHRTLGTSQWFSTTSAQPEHTFKNIKQETTNGKGSGRREKSSLRILVSLTTECAPSLIIL